MCIFHFPTRINHSTASAIDNIIFDISQFINYSVNPLTNDLSDHNAQILTLNISAHRYRERLHFIRKIYKHTIPDFIYKLSNESWDCVSDSEDVDLMFNSFLNIYLRIFDSSFPLIRSKSRKNKLDWLTSGI